VPGRIAVYYATRDGQARRIAERVQARLAQMRNVEPCRPLASNLPDAGEIASAAAVVLIAAVRYGRHLPEAEAFIARYASLANPPPLALASVNLTARKAGKTGADTNPYLRKLIARHRLSPAVAVAFAGRLDYARYRWSDRQLIRFIMLLTGGPTDLRTAADYTDWNAVDAFADESARLD
jgi:menaquinone-dependent protoporphyrinogen oxidase